MPDEIESEKVRMERENRERTARYKREDNGQRIATIADRLKFVIEELCDADDPCDKLFIDNMTNISMFALSLHIQVSKWPDDTKFKDAATKGLNALMDVCDAQLAKGYGLTVSKSPSGDLEVWRFNVPISTTLAKLADAMATATVAVIDFETSGTDTVADVITGLGVYLPEPNRSFYINLRHAAQDDRFPKYSDEELAVVLRPFLNNPTRHVIAHNAAFEIRFLLQLGLTIRCRTSCTMIHSHRVDENLRSRGKEKVSHYYVNVTYGLKELTTIYFGLKPPTILDATAGMNTLLAPAIEPVARYCVIDCLNTWRLYQRARVIINENAELRTLIDTIDDPNILVLAKMMAEGILIDVVNASAQATAYDQAIQACREGIWKATGLTWPLDTPTHMLRVLRHLRVHADIGYDPFYLPFFEGERDPSVSREVLVETFEACEHPMHRLVLALFTAKTLMEQRLSSFLTPLPQLVTNTNGRLYPNSFSSTLVTSRFSSSPNLQNLPRKMGSDDDVDEDAVWRAALPEACDQFGTTKNIFVAKPGFKLVSMDLSAAEPRYLALLFQRALTEKEEFLEAKKQELRSWRQASYGVLVNRMKEIAEPWIQKPKIVINWPTYEEDPLYQVFKYGEPFNDPYNALLVGMDPVGYSNAQAQNCAEKWLEDERWRGKRAFLALGYGSTAENLYKPLQWTLARTQQAIQSLETTYATLNPLRELTMREIIYAGEVRTLWGRPRRINGYYQLARPEPVTIGFYRKPHGIRIDYQADIIPLGNTRQGVQAFVERCCIVSDDGKTGEVVLAGNPSTGHLIHHNPLDEIVKAKHFNNIPFRNFNFNQINWVRGQDGISRELPRQERAQRQAVNAMCQSTGADHLRWLMNRMDAEICSQEIFHDCKLILTIHDSLIYEVPDEIVDQFVNVARPVMEASPPWADISMKVGIEVGNAFGDMVKVKKPVAATEKRTWWQKLVNWLKSLFGMA